jgi:hypothetical protein
MQKERLMEIVPADFVSAQDKEMQRVLDAHPDLKYYLTVLTNRYRGHIALCIEQMSNGDTDTVDVAIACSKTDTLMRRIDLPLLNTMEEWSALRLGKDVMENSI